MRYAEERAPMVRGEAWTPTLKEGEDPHDLPLSTWIGEALGAASVCWDPMMGTSVFQSQEATRISDALMAEIVRRFDADMVHACAHCDEVFGTTDDAAQRVKAHIRDRHLAPLLGLASTREMLQELKERAEKAARERGTMVTGTAMKHEMDAYLKLLPEEMLDHRTTDA